MKRVDAPSALSSPSDLDKKESDRNKNSGQFGTDFDDFSVCFQVGGFNGITRMNSAERYSASTNQWTSITEMYNPRSNFAIEVSGVLINRYAAPFEKKI